MRAEIMTEGENQWVCEKMTDDNHIIHKHGTILIHNTDKPSIQYIAMLELRQPHGGQSHTLALD